MIPKIIHYCWFGGNPLPKLALKCIASWKRFFPDYEIREWNEDNFDLNQNAYVREAYEAKKYAFVSDFARFWILYHFGGIYFDTDVEVVKSFDSIIQKGPFMGFENNGVNLKGQYISDRMLEKYCVAPGLGLGVNPGLGLYKRILDYYSKEHFIMNNGSQNLTTVVERVTEILLNCGLKQNNQLQTVEGITIYPADYFCPISTVNGKLYITNNTVSIHHFSASWVSPSHRILRKIILKLFGTRVKVWISNVMQSIKKS